MILFGGYQNGGSSLRSSHFRRYGWAVYRNRGMARQEPFGHMCPIECYSRDSQKSRSIYSHIHALAHLARVNSKNMNFVVRKHAQVLLHFVTTTTREISLPTSTTKWRMCAPTFATKWALSHAFRFRAAHHPINGSGGIKH